MIYFKDQDFVTNGDFNMIVRLSYEANDHRGLICCEYKNQEGDQKIDWLDPRELKHYTYRFTEHP
jgi:hypothetical protein